MHKFRSKLRFAYSTQSSDGGNLCTTLVLVPTTLQHGCQGAQVRRTADEQWVGGKGDT